MRTRTHAHTHTHTHQGTPRPLQVGAAVEIHSLHESPELNGVRGKVVESEDLRTGRCQVKTATGRCLAVKLVNLRRVSRGRNTDIDFMDPKTWD